MPCNVLRIDNREFRISEAHRESRDLAPPRATERDGKSARHRCVFRPTSRFFNLLILLVGVWLAPAVQAQQDYDGDDDGLIEVGSLAQLHAIRHDLDGDGAVDAADDADDYAAAFPSPLTGTATVTAMGCPTGDHDGDADTPERAGCAGYELTANLDFDTDGDGAVDADDAYWNAGAGWVPIGAFTGEFDGGGHTIANLFIDRDTWDDVGLFAVIGAGGEVRRVGVAHANVRGRGRVGPLAGSNRGRVFANYASGRVASATDKLGGLVGLNASGGRIAASYAVTAVDSGRRDSGGLVGENAGRIIASYATGGVAVRSRAGGGLVGYNNNGRIAASYSTGAISGRSSVGGLIGWIGSGSFDDVYWDTDTSGRSNARGGGQTSGELSGQTSVGLRAPTGYDCLYAGWDVDLDNADGDDDLSTGGDDPWDFGTAYSYPALSVDFNGDGTASWEEFGTQRAPGPPAGFAAAPAGADLNLSWSAPADIGSGPVTGYRYRVSSDGGSTWDPDWTAVTGLAHTIEGPLASSYAVEVQAVNAAGFGPVSRLAPPDAPDIDRVHAAVGRLRLGWVAPAVTGNLPVSGYSVQYKLASEATWRDWTHVGTGTDATITGLTNGDGQAYQVRVAARNLLGTGSFVTVGAPELVRHAAPTAQAGPDQTVGQGATVMLDGTGSSDPEGEALSYAWSQTGGTPRVVLSDGAAARPTFTAPGQLTSDAVLEFSLTVTDARGLASDADTVAVTVTAGNAGPTANAGPDRTVAEGTAVTLDGSGSRDPENQVLSYAWTFRQTRGTPIPITLSDAAAVRPAVTLPAQLVDDAVIEFSLRVTDTRNAASVDMVVITVTAGANDAPTADAGPDRRVAEGALVTLDGSGSADPESEVLSYAWSQTDGTPNVVLSDSAVASPTFTAPAQLTVDAVLEFSLTVTDARGLVSTADTAVITVTAGANDAPTADAGPDQTVAEGVLVTLDGSGSADPEGEALSYAWSQTGGTPEVELSDSAASTPTFTAPAQLTVDAVLEFSLAVTDARGLVSAADTVVVTVLVPHDYDRDDDGLVEVGGLAQLHAIRYDLDGDGAADNAGDAADYAAAFPVPLTATATVTAMGCPTGDHDGDADTPERAGCAGYELTANLDFDTDGDGDVDADDAYWNAGAGWEPIDAFTGELDGGGHTIANLFIDRGGAPRIGLFGRLSAGGTVRRLGLPGANVTGGENVGPLAGRSEGRVIASYATGQAMARVKTIGGLVGWNGGAIVASYAMVETVNGDGDGGGLAGRNVGEIVASYATGRVAGRHGGGLVGWNNRGGIFASYATGRIDVSGTRGGLIGWNSSGSFADVYWDTDTSGRSNARGGGQTSGELSGQTSVGLRAPTGYDCLYAGWDVDLDNADGDDDLSTGGDDPWDFGTAYSYPALSVDFNGDGTASWEEFGTQRAPGPPAGFAAAPAGADLNLSWSAPADIGSGPVTGYRYRVSSDGGSTWDPDWTAVTGLAHTIEGPLASSYAVEVQAVNAAGFGPVSRLAPPDAPDIDRVHAAVGRLRLGWVAPAVTGNLPVSGYSVQYKLASEATWRDWTHVGTGTDATITGLTNGDGQAYQVRVAARNLLGTGSFVTVGAPELVRHAAPTAQAGPDQTVGQGATVMLDGTGSSDPEGEALSYAWSQTGGTPRVVLSDGAAARPTFTAPGQLTSDAVLEFSLTVTDARGLASDADTVAVTVTAGNAGPTANAGPDRTVAEGTAVTLDGSGSRDPENQVLSYAWTFRQTRGTPIPITLSDAAAVRPAVTLPAQLVDDAVIEFSLRVTDTREAASVDMVVITVTAGANDAPTADAGPDRTVAEGALVTLDGSGSADPEGEALSYAWSQTGGSPEVVLSDHAAASPTFTAPAQLTVDAVLEFSLTVTDARGLASTADTAVITVTAGANDAPTADAGLDQAVAEGALVTLDGSGSTDPEGEALSYAWSQTGGSPEVVLSDRAAASPTFTAPAQLTVDAVTLEFSLTVTDARGLASDADTVVVTVLVPQDYDRDDDGLIEVGALAQLHAMRYDLDGDGAADAAGDADDYAAAFPSPLTATATATATAMGCPTGDHDGDADTPERAGCAGYELTANLDFDTDGDGDVDADDAYWNAGAGWEPIGAFTAEFDGGGHTISNLFIDRNTWDDVGLFAVIGAGGEVRRVGVAHANVRGRGRVGPLAGNNRGRVFASYASGSVGSASDKVGGLVGLNASGGRIAASYAVTAVNSGRRDGGGLVGENAGRITASYATGDVTLHSRAAGGLVGYNNNGGIATSYATGAASGSSSLGGLIGWNGSGSFADILWDTDTSGRSNAVGGGQSSGDFSGYTTVQLQAPTGYTGIYAGWNVDLDNADGDDDRATGGDDPWDFGTASSYPALSVDFNGDGTASWEEFGTQRETPGAFAITLDAENTNSRGIWSDGETLWVADHLDWKVYAYRLLDGARLAERDIEVSRYGWGEPHGLWSDGETLWVVVGDRLRAHRLSDGAAQTSGHLLIERANESRIEVRGLWSDGETLWVSRVAQDQLWAHRLVDGASQASRDIDISANNSLPGGIASDGETIWVVEQDQGTVPAYRLWDGSREPARDLEPGWDEVSLFGLWSDGESMWISERNSGEVRRLRLPVRPAEDNEALRELALTDVEFGKFLSAKGSYSAAVSNAVSTTTVTAAPFADGATVVIEDAQGATTGRQRSVSLSEGENEITVTVTSPDGTRTRAYTVVVKREAAAALTARFENVPATHDGSSEFEFELHFSEEVKIGYAALRDSAFEVTGGTVTGARRLTQGSNIGWRITVQPAGSGNVEIALPANRACDAVGAVCTAAGKQLSEGVKVTVEDEAGYTPILASISANAAPVSEGGAAMFTVTLSRAAVNPLSVALRFTETGTMLSPDPPASVTLEEGDESVSLGVATIDDRVVESDSAVSAALGAGAGYTVGEPSSATATVLDNDAGAFAVQFDQAELSEGQTATLTVRITNGVVFAVDQTLTLAFAGTASASDHSVPSTLTLLAGTSAAQAMVSAVDDEDAEDSETLTVTVSLNGTEIGSAMLTIAASDPLSDDASLSTLVLSGIDFGVFAAEVTGYMAAVDDTTTATTVTATPSDTAATVVIADANGETVGGERTVSLSHGANSIRVTVTAEDGTTTRTYSITVTRVEWSTITLDAENMDPRGIWSDGETLWVADHLDWKVYAYRLLDGARLAERDIEVSRYGWGEPHGLWSDGETLWVVVGDRLRAHRLSDGAAQTSGHLLIERANESRIEVRGLWSDGETLWVSRVAQDELWAHRLVDGAGQASRDIDISASNSLPGGIASDGETMWVVEQDQGTVPAYRLWDGSREPARDLEPGWDDVSLFGLWSDGESMWISERNSGEVRRLRLPVRPAEDNEALRELALTDVEFGKFLSAKGSYSAAVSNAVSTTTVTAAPFADGATVVIEDAQGATTGRQRSVSLSEGENEITVTVTSPDGTRTQRLYGGGEAGGGGGADGALSRTCPRPTTARASSSSNCISAKR